MTLDKVERPGKTLVWSPPDGKAEAVGEFVLIYLNVEKSKEGDRTLSLNNFQLLSEQGNAYTPVSCCQLYAFTKEVRPLTFATEFKAGSSFDILVVFDLPPSATELTLTMSSGKGLTWRLN